MWPKISPRFPSPKTIEAFLSSQSKVEFTYTAVGATARTPPPGYVVDHNRIKLGEGEQVFRAAKAALETWRHFNLGWVEAKPMEDSIQVGGVVAVVARSLGVWWLNACRIVYVVNKDDGAVARFGFAYGTVPAHAESGEERFLIEWDRADDGVWYDILAFSKPHGLLSRLGNPWLRFLQRRFAEDSKAAMARHTSSVPTDSTSAAPSA
jgi:uncharacterized protein (UPF0548 family)